MDEKKKNIEYTGMEVAVIGMTGRFPGAKNLDEYWNKLVNGIESISFFNMEELKSYGLNPEELNHPDYVGAKGVLEDVEYFDASFFGYTFEEAEVMTPQMRIFHECAWEALEDAGYEPDCYQGLIGVFAGGAQDTYWEIMCTLSGKTEELGVMEAGLLNSKDPLGTRLSYKLNLKGPSYSLYTACSTSGVAIHQACQNLLVGECHMALAGGVSVWFPPKAGYIYEEGVFYSPDGHCRAFDADARGFVYGDGIGVVILKLLEDALSDRDHIYAVIRATALNNDGNRKVGYAVPSKSGETAVIRAALHSSGVDPGSISYIEAHGTGTNIGDTIELEALESAYVTGTKGTIAIGSVKSNIGHLNCAAGMSAMIKTILALNHRCIPPSLHVRVPNPQFDFENSPFYVVSEPTPWGNDSSILRAGVNIFGIGGTNCHAILEEAPAGMLENKDQSLRPFYLIMLSAKTETALEQMTQNLTDHFMYHREINLADTAYTLQVGRKNYKYRRFWLKSGLAKNIDLLSPGGESSSFNAEKEGTAVTEEKKRPVIFLFSGVDADSPYINLGWELYQTETLFREEMDRCFDILQTIGDYHIKKILYPGVEDEHQGVHREYSVLHPVIAQLIIFVVQYALARLIIKWGVKPAVMMGDSLGEYTVAAISGVFSLEDVLKLVVCRARLHHQVQGGLMSDVPIEEGETVPVLKPFEEQLEQVSFNKPGIPFISNLTGKKIIDNDVACTQYWANHLKNPLQLDRGITELTGEPNAIFIEVGPAGDLSSLVSNYLGNNPEQRLINLIRQPDFKIPDTAYLLGKLGLLWLYGLNIDWEGFYSNEKRSRVSLPTYPFERKRYWIEGTPFSLMGKDNIVKGSRKIKKQANISNWFFTPVWNQLPPVPLQSVKPGNSQQGANSNGGWLVMSDTLGIGTRLVEQLKAQNQDVLEVKPGSGFKREKDGSYTLDPRRKSDYEKLVTTICQTRQMPQQVVHLWSVYRESDRGGEELITHRQVTEAQDLGLFSLLFLVGAIERENITIMGTLDIAVITNNMQAVCNESYLCPEKSTVMGLVNVIPQENPSIRCRSIDILLPRSTTQTGDWQYQRLADQLLTELHTVSPGKMMALRDNLRWLRAYEPIKLESPPTADIFLRKEGVYLVIGGLGGIGFTMAQYLAHSLKARLVLMGRSDFPNRHQWDQWLSTHSQTDSVSQQIGKIREMEQAGAMVRVFSGDISDESQLGKVIEQAEETFGVINGVIHSAGTEYPEAVAPVGMLEKKHFEMYFQAKLWGILNLQKLMAHKKPDFFFINSSITSILGGIGFSAYTAANIFMDSYLHHHNRLHPVPWLGVNWDTWRFSAKPQHPGTVGESISELYVIPEEGIEVFKRVLQLKCGQVVHSTGDLLARIYQWIQLETIDPREEEDKSLLPSTGDQLFSLYEAPRYPMEKQMVEIWQNFFGFEKLGIHDDFFKMGGNSLKAISLINLIKRHLNVDVPISLFFEKPTIEKIANYASRAKKTKHRFIQQTEKREYYPLSSAQRRMYVVNRIEPESTSYNIPSMLCLLGSLDRNKLDDIFQQLIERHESFRTSFIMLEDEPVQKVHDEVEFEVQFYDLETRAANPHKTEVTNIIDDFIRFFDLSHAPLLRVGLIKEKQNNYILMVDMHHIISDGFSSGIFMKDFVTLYNGRQLSTLKLQYKDYSKWQKKLQKQNRDEEKRQEQFWLKQFSSKEDIPVLALPYDYSRPSFQSFEGDIFYFEIDSQETKALNNLAEKEQTTLYVIILSCFHLLLAKLSNQEEIIIGTPVLGRNHVDLEQIIGMFVNTLALKNTSYSQMTFSQFVREVKTNTINALQNQDYPFEKLVDQVPVDRDVSRTPLFDVLFVLQNIQQPQTELTGLTLKPFVYSNQNVKFDLTLQGFEEKGKLKFDFEYSTALFKTETIKRFVGYFNKIRLSVLDNPGQKISEIEILTPEERTRLLYEFNNTAVEYLRQKAIHRLFREQVERTPDHIALIGKLQNTNYKLQTKNRSQITNYEQSGVLQADSNDFGRNISISYQELNKRCDQLAGVLIEKGIKPDIIVGIMVERSVKMIIGILGILKAGGAYLPIDPDYPAERKQYILKDSNAKVLLAAPQTQVNGEAEVEENFGHLPGLSFQSINIDPGFAPDIEPSLSTLTSTCQVSPTNLAYVIYTSGSTGRPKGVMIQHASVVNRLNWMQRFYPIDEEDVILQKTPYTFDVSVWELFWWSFQGASLCLLDHGEEKNPEAITEAVEKNKVTLMHFVPSMLTGFLEYLGVAIDENLNKLASLKQVFASGEALGTHQVETFNQLLQKHNRTKLINLYGPTEATVDVSYFNCFDGPYKGNAQSVPIGKPIDNIQLYVVDQYFRLQAVGIPGELCISGDGLARGYLNKPGLTAEKFDHDLWNYQDYHDKKNSQRLYKTGDLARWLPDGNIEFLGRIDHQVKIRGYRIELGEIETQLQRYSGIKEALLMIRQDAKGDKFLCAYIVPQPVDPGKGNPPQSLKLSVLRDYLASRLPAYMVPAYFVILEKFPLTANGKVDRKVLPMPEATGLSSDVEYAAPRNVIERKLTEIWQEVLGRKLIGIDDNFFELGGDSIKALIIAARIRKIFNMEIRISIFLTKLTIRGIAEYVVGIPDTRYSSIEPAEKQEYYPLSSAQKRLYLLQQMNPRGTAYNITQTNILEGNVDIKKLEDIFKVIIQRHECYRTSYIMVNEEPVQRIHYNSQPDFNIRLLEVPGGNLSSSLNVEEVIGDFIQPFELSRPPLIRVALMETAENQYVLVIDTHHVGHDMVSHHIAIKEIVALYLGEAAPLLKLQYKEYVLWINSPDQQKKLKRQEEYWLEQFQGEIPVLNLPFDYPRPAYQSFAGNTPEFEIGEEETNALKSLAAKEKNSLYVVLLSIFYVLLSKLGGSEDIVIGTPVVGRGHEDLENIIGMFVNTVAIRNFPIGEKTFSNFMQEVKTNSLNSLENQDYPFEELADQVQVTRDVSRNPLFDVMFVMFNIDPPQLQIPGITFKPYGFANNTSKFDLTLIAREPADKLLFSLEYNTELFKAETITRFIRYFEEIVRSVLENSGQEISGIEILPQEEKVRILYDFNDTRAEYPVDKTIHQLFAEQVERTPDFIAIKGLFNWKSQIPNPKQIQKTQIQNSKHLNRESTGQDVSVTYRELNEKSSGLAHLLREKGVGPDTIVGIMMTRCVEMIFGIIGILKAGGAYMPIDPDYPEKRKQYMLKDSSAKILLTWQDITNSAGIRDFEFGISLPQGRQLAYVIYTSGTTGQPKGVLIHHRNLVRLMINDQFPFDFSGHDVWTMFHSYCFDFSVWEMYGALLYGGKLVIISQITARDPGRYLQILKQQAVTVLNQVPASFYNLATEELTHPDSQLVLRYVIFGGEALAPMQLKEWKQKYPQTKLVNMYGITETTVHVTFKEITTNEIETNTSNIGKPIPTLSVYTTDKYLKPVPLGTPGELCVSGAGVARGYLNRPELSAEKFDHDLWDYQDYHDEKINQKRLRGIQVLHGRFSRKESPCASRSRRQKLYRTGDLGRWLASGDIEYLGRLDRQVKIRGYRIELGEIETQLQRYSGIKEALLMISRDAKGDKFLCAYIVPQPVDPGSDNPPQPLKLSVLRDYLTSRLPSYMVPAYFVILEKFPLTANGKVDRKVLPLPEVTGLAGDVEYAAPRNVVEKKLTEIWQEVLGRKLIGIDENFFELGGDSIKAMTIAAKSRKIFNMEIPITLFFHSPTIRETAGYITANKRETYLPVEKAIEAVELKEYYPLSSSQKRMYVTHRMEQESIAYNMPNMARLSGTLNREQALDVFKKMIKRHESLRTSFIVVNDEPVQKVHDKVDFEIEYNEMPGTEHHTQEEVGESAVSPVIIKKIKDFTRPFDLSQPPLLRIKLIKLDEKTHILAVDTHHIIYDAYSAEILTKDLSALLNDRQLPPLRIQYKDFSEWQIQVNETFKKQEDYWLNQFKGDIPLLHLPTDYPRPPIRSVDDGDTICYTFPEDLSEKCTHMQKKTDTTLFILLLAVYDVLLFKYTGQEDIVVGSPTAGRWHEDLENVIGVFLNMLPMRSQPHPGKSFAEFLQEVKENTLGAFKNQDYPFEELVKKLGLQGETSRNPLFDTEFAVNNIESREIQIPGLKIEGYDTGLQFAKFDLHFLAINNNGTIDLILRYYTAIFSKSSAEKIMQHFIEIVKQVVDNPEIKLEDINVSIDLLTVKSKVTEEEQGDFQF